MALSKQFELYNQSGALFHLCFYSIGHNIKTDWYELSEEIQEYFTSRKIKML